MKKIVYHTTFSFTLIVFFSTLTTLAQDTIDGDYSRYVRLFTAGKEPDVAADVSWRSAYSRHEWVRYADGTEFRNPLPEAQVLMGLYMLGTVNKKLNYEIEQIVLEKALLSQTFSETIVLDQIVAEMEKDPIFKDPIFAGADGIQIRSDGELVGDFRGIRFNVEKQLRQRMTSGVPRKLMIENRAIVNLFRPDIEEGWAAQYRAIREQISVLDELADSFAFNWNADRKEEELLRLMENTYVKRDAEERAKLEIEARPKNLNAEEIMEIKGRKLQEVAEEELEKIVAKHTAFKYMVGVYQGMDYHVRDLKKIYRYYFDAANQGNPIAQYHIALFLVYFGDVLDIKEDRIKEMSQNCLEKAYHSDLARERVVELRDQLLAEDKKIEKRNEDTRKKIETLVRLEHERIDMVENVCIQMAKRIKRINEVQRRIIEEMERERERRAMIEMEHIRSSAMIVAEHLRRRSMLEAELARRMPTLFLPQQGIQQRSR